jgi:hypothetical protein
MNDAANHGQAPECPSDGLRMNATIVGWRCPICGLAALPIGGSTLDSSRAAHPAFR